MIGQLRSAYCANNKRRAIICVELYSPRLADRLIVKERERGRYRTNRSTEVAERVRFAEVDTTSD